MSAVIIDAKRIAEEIKAEVASEIKLLVSSGKPKPGLATVLVGDDPASHVYVKSKHKACELVGIESFSYELPASSTQQEVENLVKRLNDDPNVSGILVQMPLPEGLDKYRILSSVAITKDVDGFNPMNLGWLAQKDSKPKFIPCTPAGIMVLLEKTVPSLQGKNAVVLGRSEIVGMPVALLLVRANTTLTICHSKTRNISEIVRQADILVAAIGKPNYVKADWVKPGAVIIDVGINRIDDPTHPKGSRLVGDVSFDEVKEIAGAITPVPGGVGLMTIAMLMSNTLRAAKMSG